MLSIQISILHIVYLVKIVWILARSPQLPMNVPLKATNPVFKVLNARYPDA